MKEYFDDIFKGVWTVLVGMKITFMHMFTPAVTRQYPDVRMQLPERARNRLYVNMDDCIGCDQCSAACPVNCITIETVKAVAGDDVGTTSTGQKKRLWVTTFDIDIGKCCYCALCVPPCPTECIKMTDVYEFSEYNRNDLIYNYVTLSPAEIADVKAKAVVAEKEAAEKKAAAAAAAKAAAEAKAGAAPPQAKPPEPPAGGEAPTRRTPVELYDIIFWFFAAVTLGSAAVVVFSRNIIHSAFALLFTFFGVAGIYVLLSADFIAITQILVYVGGILVLLVFGVMLTNKVVSVEIKTDTMQIGPASLVTGGIFGILFWYLIGTEWRVIPSENALPTTAGELGRMMMTTYLLPFEVASVVLLVALVGAAMISRKRRA